MKIYIYIPVVAWAGRRAARAARQLPMELARRVCCGYRQLYLFIYLSISIYIHMPLSGVYNHHHLWQPGKVTGRHEQRDSFPWN